MTPNLDIKPDIKVSLKQTFGIDSKMEVDAFSKKKFIIYMKLIKVINSIETQHWPSFQGFHLIKEF